MNNRSVRVGAVAGGIGGMAMAMWSMLVLAATGNGFWSPVNLIAHTFYDKAPLDGAFNGTAALVGVGAHMMIAMSLGVAIALAAHRFCTRTAGTPALALAASMVAWVGGIVTWNAVDSAAFDAFTPWVLLTGHAMFAMAAGAVVAALGAEATRTTRAAVRTPELIDA